MAKLINIGFGNVVNSRKIVAVVSPDAAPVKRMDKICNDEETVRLHSHIAGMRKMLEESEGIGRKLDFMAQEMNREANTIGSKANDITITGYMLDLKSEIEKIREQVQNIE